jgi:hypothetical protein
MSNRIKTSDISPGQQLPLTSGRLDFIQDNIETLASSIVKGLTSYTTGDIIYLTGVNVVFPGSLPGTGSVTTGAIYYNGLIYQVDANASISLTAGQTLLWTLVTTTSDLATFYPNGFTANVRQTQKFVLVAGSSGGSGVSGYVADYNSAVVKRYTPYSLGTWTNLTLINSYTSLGSNYTPQYRVDSYGYVQLRGVIQAPGTVTSTTFAKIPVGSSVSQTYLLSCAPNILGSQYFTLLVSMSGVPSQIQLDISTVSGGNVPASSQISITTPMLS